MFEPNLDCIELISQAQQPYIISPHLTLLKTKIKFNVSNAVPYDDL